MKFIAKRLRHVECLHDEHLIPPSSSEDARRRWDRFNNKARLTDVLNEEQCLLCAYTELRPDEIGIGTHIEHVKPKSKYPALTSPIGIWLLVPLQARICRNRTIRGMSLQGMRRRAASIERGLCLPCDRELSAIISYTSVTAWLCLRQLNPVGIRKKQSIPSGC